MIEVQNKFLNIALRTTAWILMLAFVGYGVPFIKHTLFPNRTTKIENMLRGASFENCTIQVNRENETQITLTVESEGTQAVTTEIYRDVTEELSPEAGSRVLFAHSVNQNPDKSYYLTQTQIWADNDLDHVHRLDVKRCDLMQSKSGSVQYEKHVPVYECAVANQKMICTGTK